LLWRGRVAPAKDTGRRQAADEAHVRVEAHQFLPLLVAAGLAEGPQRRERELQAALRPEGKRIPWLVLVVRRIAFWVVAATGRCSRKNRVFSIGREKGGPPEEKTNWHLAGSHEKGAAVRIG